MPPLLAYISEAAEWTAQEGQLSAQECANSALETWDWTSVAIFTCEKSCATNENGLNVVIEYVHIFEEN